MKCIVSVSKKHSSVWRIYYYDVDQEGNESFYIQDGTGMYNGINVISGDEVSRGDLVEVYGDYVEFYDRSEIVMDNLQIISSGNTLPEPEVLSLDQEDWEPWEGVLIQIQNVAVSNDDAEYGEWDVSDLSGASTMRIDKYFFIPL